MCTQNSWPVGWGTAHPVWGTVCNRERRHNTFELLEISFLAGHSVHRPLLQGCCCGDG
jgi:hypothetical protein